MEIVMAGILPGRIAFRFIFQMFHSRQAALTGVCFFACAV
jgi:hypothetical protein